MVLDNYYPVDFLKFDHKFIENLKKGKKEPQTQCVTRQIKHLACSHLILTLKQEKKCWSVMPFLKYKFRKNQITWCNTLNFLQNELLDENIQGNYFPMIKHLYTAVNTSTRRSRLSYKQKQVTSSITVQLPKAISEMITFSTNKAT